MKVVLKVTVMAKFVEAAQANSEVDYIVVSEEEFCELRADRRVHQYIQHPTYWTPSDAMTAETITTKAFEFTGKVPRVDYRPMWRSASREKFHGVPLYVVPKDYMPR